MTDEIITSPKNSMKGWNFLTLLWNHKNAVIGALTAILFIFLVIKMLVSSTVYTPEVIITGPATIAAAFWTAINGILYFKSEQKK